MLFNTLTLNTINSFQLINDSIIISPKIIGVRDTANSIVVFINLDTLENPPIEKPFGILKFKEFIEILKIIGDEPKITLDEKGVLDIQGGGIKCRYLTTDTSILESVCGVNPKVLENVNLADEIVTFNLTTPILEKVKKVSNLFGFDDMVINTLGDTQKLNIIVTENGVGSTQNGNELSLEVDAEIKVPTKVYLSIKNLKKIPNVNYQATLLKHQKHNNFILRLVPIDNEAVTVLIPSKSV